MKRWIPLFLLSILAGSAGAVPVSTWPGAGGGGSSVYQAADCGADVLGAPSGSICADTDTDALYICEAPGPCSGTTAWTAYVSAGGLAAADIDTSLEIDTIVGDDTGSGALVFANTPTLVTPVLGVATATSIVAPLISSLTDVIIDLDTDNNIAVESLIIRGQDPDVTLAEVSEAGLLTALSIQATTGAIVSSAVANPYVQVVDTDTNDTADTGSLRLENATGTICWEAAPTGTDVCISIDANELLELGATRGVKFTEIDAADLTDCSAFSLTGGGIFYDDSENKFKKCQNQTLSDLDTTGAGGSTALESADTPDRDIRYNTTANLWCVDEDGDGVPCELNVPGDGLGSELALTAAEEIWVVDAVGDPACVDLYNSGGPPQNAGFPDYECDSDGTTDVTYAAADGVVNGYDLQSAILSCGTDHTYLNNKHVCQIRLPVGTFVFEDTVTLGLFNNRPAGVIIRGEGPCWPTGGTAPWTTGGTRLIWTGTEGGRMFSIQYAAGLRFEDFCAITDADFMADSLTAPSSQMNGGVNNTSMGASIVFDFNSDGTNSYGSSFTGIYNVNIWGPRGGTATTPEAWADGGGGLSTVVTDTGHTVSNGDSVRINGTSAYNGVHTASNVVAGTSYELDVAFGTDEGVVGSALVVAPINSTGIRVTEEGGGKSVQHDDITLRNSHIDRLDFAIWQDVLQALTNKAEDSEVNGQSGVFYIAGGTWDAIGVTVDCFTSDCVVFDFPTSGGAASPQEILIDNIYWESGSTAETFLRISDGSCDVDGDGDCSEGASATGATLAPIIVSNSYLNAQGTVGTLTLLDANVGRGGVVFRDNHITQNGGTGPEVKIKISSMDDIDQATVIFDGNMGTGQLFGDVSVVSGVTTALPNLSIRNLETEPATGIVYNDINFDRTRDNGEMLTAGALDAVGAGAITIGSADVTEVDINADGVEFHENDTLTDCSTFSATGGGIYYDDSENKFKKCQNNSLSDLDTSGGTPSFAAITTGTNTEAGGLIVGTAGSLSTSGTGTILGQTSINLSGLTSATACSTIRTAINDFNTKTSSVNLRIYGSIAITDEDHLEDRGNYRSCFHIGSATEALTLSDGYFLRIDFTDAHFSFTDATQSEPIIFMQIGDTYGSGSDPIGVNEPGEVADVVSLRGNVYMDFVSDVDTNGANPDWVVGDIPTIPLHVNGSSTSIIGIMWSNAHYMDTADFHYSLNSTVADTDNIGMFLQYSFSTNFGHPRIMNFGTGVITQGSNGGALVEHGEIRGNNVGIVIGNTIDNLNFEFDDGTDMADQNKGPTFRGGTFEGNRYGNLMVFATSGPTTIDDMYIENGTQDFHSIILGGGFCSLAVNEPCVFDADCSAGTCTEANGDLKNVQLTSESSFGTGNTAYPASVSLGPNAQDTAGGNGRFPIVIDSDFGYFADGASNLTPFTYNTAATSRVIIKEPPQLTDLDVQVWGYPYIQYGFSGYLNQAKGTGAITVYGDDLLRTRTYTNAGAAAQTTYTLPAANISYKPVTFCHTGGAGYVGVNPVAGDAIHWSGFTMADGQEVRSAASEYACITLEALTTDAGADTDWVVTASSGNWTGPDSSTTMPTINANIDAVSTGTITIGSADVTDITLEPGTGEVKVTGTIEDTDAGDWSITEAGVATFASADVTGALSAASLTVDPSDTPNVLLEDSEDSSQAQILAESTATDVVLSLRTDVAGTLTTFAEVDGVTETVDILKPLVVGDGSAIANGKVEIGGESNEVTLIVEADGSQTANLVNFQDSAGSVLAWISATMEAVFPGFVLYGAEPTFWFNDTTFTADGTPEAKIVGTILADDTGDLDLIVEEADNNYYTGLSVTAPSGVGASQIGDIDAGAYFSVAETTGAMTGVGAVSIALSASQPITGGVSRITTTDGTETAACTGQWYIADNATATNPTTYTLPEIDGTTAEGYSCCFYDFGGGNGTIVLDPTATDAIVLTSGTAITAGDTASSSGTDSEFACILAIAANTWAILGENGTWVDTP